ncbi:Acetyltransferase (GNAT) family protein [Lentzea waywayandensis]|uniref:Acetyltransferase (GNAT) family protein n=1 Tax=Lentzea waywayandensis TaxID=84724 RepID=A0A1I6F486_9PSEU|nr:Acetyltransferase (GNAT) family protein [Lentzea waywayandensis]
MRGLRIRPAQPEDLPSLAGSLGQAGYFADRLDRQLDDRGILLTAWHAGVVIGAVYLWLEPAEEREIRTHLPGTPLVTHLEVHPDHQGRGAGTSLLHASEWLLACKGYREVALAVEVGNERAERLYTRLGFREWPHSQVKCYSSAEGNGHRIVETCKVLVKPLPG